jgi:hypothetical protein
MIYNFYYLSIHNLILKVFIIQIQEQTLLFLEFRAYFFYLLYFFKLKITDFIT